MSEELTFEQMLEESFKTIHTGEVVEGTVIDVKPEEIILNIGYKADGILTKYEYTNDNSVDLTTVVKVGDTLEVKILKVNDGDGQVLVTYKRLQQERGSKKIEEAFNNGEVLKAVVTQVQDGGLTVIVDETRIFIPASLVSDTYERDLTKYLNQEIEFVVIEFNPRKRRCIGDRKQLLVAKKEELQKEVFARIHEGDVVEGTVKNVTDFGAFIDLGGADGLLHISEMSWGRVEHPKKVFKIGDKLNVLIKEINGNKVALSLKFDDQNPWKDAAEKYAIGNVVTGKVARMTDFGAFVELADGSMICGECAARVRILYPKSFTWVNVYYSSDTDDDDDYYSNEDTRWIDPLSDISFGAFQDALKKADEERIARKARLGARKAYFNVDEISRMIKYPGKGRKVATNEYVVTGTVLLGAVDSTGVISVARKERSFTKDIKRVETPHDNSSVMEKTAFLSEGCYGGLILEGDAPYIYPGDILTID